MKANVPSNRVVRASQLGPPDVLQLTHEPVREPVSGEIRLRVHALGLNRAEVMFRTGHYTETPQFPARIGSEAAGVVASVGADVTEFKAGDRVSTIPGFSMNQCGVAGDTAVVPASHGFGAVFGAFHNLRYVAGSARKISSSPCRSTSPVISTGSATISSTCLFTGLPSAETSNR